MFCIFENATPKTTKTKIRLRWFWGCKKIKSVVKNQPASADAVNVG
jgi:hypothetical protein